MYKVMYGDEELYIPKNLSKVILEPVLELSITSENKMTFLIPKINPLYEKVKNKDKLVSVYKDDTKIFVGEIKSLEKTMDLNIKASVSGALSFLADTIQPQREFHNITPRLFLEELLKKHNEVADENKRFKVGIVSVTDPNDSLYRFTDFEDTLTAINEKLVKRLGGFLRIRYEESMYLDYLNIEDIGAVANQSIAFGENLLDYTENLNSEELITALIPLGAEIEKTDEENNTSPLRTYTDITSVNNGKNYIVSEEAKERFGFVCRVVHFEDVNVSSNLLKKAREYLHSNQFEDLTLNLKSVDLSILGAGEGEINIGDKVRCIAKIFGMDRIFPLYKKTIYLDRPHEERLILGSEKDKVSFTARTMDSIKELKEEIVLSSKIQNERIKSAVDNLTLKMTGGFQGGYKLSEYDNEGRWLRDLYMDTMDKNTASKVLQVNMHGIGGSKNGYKGPYNIGMTLDGEVLGDRILAGSITAEKLSVGYKSLVERQINTAKDDAIKTTNDKLAKNYYTMSEVNTMLKTSKDSIEAEVSSVKLDMYEKNGNYYGKGAPTRSNYPADKWENDEERKLHLGDFYYDTNTGYAYRYILRGKCLELVFDEKTRTESLPYDYIEIYYERNNVLYKMPKRGGNLGSIKVYIPSNELYIFFKTDSSGEYYGFKINEINYDNSKTYEILGEKVDNLPTEIKERIELRGENYPESEHNYKSNLRSLYKYSYDGEIKYSNAYDWVRVEDMDIKSALDNSKNALAKLSIMENKISSLVKKGEFGSFMEQNYNSFLLGFNHSSRYIQITPGEISFYAGTISENNKRAVFDDSGQRFYRDGYYVGKIGTNYWRDNNSHKGLTFDLDAQGKYIAFSQLERSGDNSYRTMLTFSRANSIYDSYGIHLGCDMDCHGWKIKDPQWNNGFGVTGSFRFVQVTEMDSDGTARKWFNNSEMVFENGILMHLRVGAD